MTQGSDQGGAAGGGGAAGAMTIGSMVTVAGILLLFVVFAFGLVSLQYCFNAWDRDRGEQGGDDAPGGQRRRRRGAGPPSGGAGTTTRRAATRGVDPDLLRLLPVTVYHRAAAAAPGSKEDDGAVECAVCLAELEDGEEARFLPRCGHGFHAGCVDTWLASHTTCPLCRLTVAKPDATAAALLPRVPPEPANYAAADLPASVLLGVSDHQGAVAMATGASTRATGALVIEIPEVVSVPAPATRDAAKSPGSARLRSSFRRLWSFGRQGAGASSSCSCAGGSEGPDLEQGTSIATDRPDRKATPNF